MAETIREDKEGNFSSFVVANQDKYMDEHGHLSKALMADLKDLKYNELLNLEEKIKNSRLPTEDLFGIKRRLCTVCEGACSGYEPNNLIGQ